MSIDIENDNIYILLEIISCLISFSSVLIAIPLIITKYLFNNKEDKRISGIILHTQEHDINGKKIMNQRDHDYSSQEMEDLINTTCKIVFKLLKEQEKK